MRTCRLAATVVSSTLILACSGGSASEAVAPSFDEAAGAAGPSASGHGNWINSAGEYVSRSFHARERAPGEATGSWVYHFTSPTGDRRMNRGRVTCLRILAPNDAVISGVVEVTENPALLGQTQIFRVIDMGEGSTEPDRMSALFARTPASGIDCRSFTPLITTPIESGNIQVKP